jgi:hypothetical protein
MSELFVVDVRTINEHLQEIFVGGELMQEAVIRKTRNTAADGKSYPTSPSPREEGSREASI